MPPVDDFQAKVIAAMSGNRSPHSLIAGGSALHQHGWRPSNDINVFISGSETIPHEASKDLASLRQAGFEAEITKKFEGMFEAVVTKEEEGATLVQWVAYSGNNFYPPVKDPDFGYRLSFMDLAINKVIAAASRKQARDLLDLRLVGRAALPLWNALCAAPGKDASITPLSALNAIRRNAQYSASELRDAAIFPDGADPVIFAKKVRTMLDRAEEHLQKLPTGAAGSILINAGTGQPLTSPPADPEGPTWCKVHPTKGPMWPSGPNLDGYIIRKLVRRFGRHGGRFWQAPGHGNRQIDG